MRKLSIKDPYLPFVSIMLMVGLLVTLTSISVHYRTSMEIEQGKVLEFVESQARVVAAVARFDSKYNSDAHPLGAKEATLSQLLETLGQRDDFSSSGEVFLAHRNKQLELVLDYTPHTITEEQPLSGVTEQALDLALNGESGTIFGADHRGQQVLVAYTHLPDLDRGLIAKVDMSELRAPFVSASFAAFFASLVVVTLGSLLFKQIQQLKTLPDNQGVIHENHSGIDESERFFYLIIIMAIICITVNICSAISLYYSSYERCQDHLLLLVKNQVSLINSVSRFDAEYSQDDHSQGATGATLSQVFDAYNQSEGFGESGEYIVGHRVGDQIEIVFRQRDKAKQNVQLIFSSVEATPFRQALNGTSGMFIGPDYLNNTVIAAYGPLGTLDYALVVKIDLAEVRAPFIQGSIITSSLAFSILIIAAALLARMTKPFKKHNNPMTLSSRFESLEVSPISNSLLLFTAGLIAIILLLDISTPSGIAGGVPYVAVVAMGWWFPQRRHIVILSTIVSILTLMVYFLNFETNEWQSLINRSYTLFVIWVTALTLNLAKASEIARDIQASTLKKLSLAVEYSPTGVMITNPEGSIEYVNPRFLDNTEYSIDEVLGKNPRILNSGETPQATFDDMWITINQGKEWRGEIINRKKNGEIFWEETSIYPIQSKAGDIQNFVCLKENITQRKQDQEALQHKATHDELTGLPNAMLGRDRLDGAIARAKREQEKAVVLFVDLDGFKAVNDTFGHEAGDLVLKEVAVRLKESVREVDTIARIGGDEFLVVLGGIHQFSDVESIASKIISSLNQPYQKIEDSIKIDVDASIELGSSLGIAFYPEHGSDADQLIKCADAAMYSIKRSGKNNYSIYQTQCDL